MCVYSNHNILNSFKIVLNCRNGSLDVYYKKVIFAFYVTTIIVSVIFRQVFNRFNIPTFLNDKKLLSFSEDHKKSLIA